MPALFGLAPEVVLAIAALSLVCVVFALRGLLTGWQFTFGLVLVGLDGKGGIAALLNFSTHKLGIRIGFDFGKYVRAANTAVVNILQDHLEAAETELAWTWHKMAQVWQATAEAVTWLASETAATAELLWKVRLPKWTKYAPIPLLLPLLIPKVIRALRPYFHGTTHTTIKYITNVYPKAAVHAAVHAVPAAIPGINAIPGIRADIRGLTKRWARIHARLRKLEIAIGATAFAATMANALGLRVSCLRPGGNVYRALRHICGLPKWIMDFLLLGTMEAFVAGELCDFTDLLITTTEGLRPGLMEFVSVEGVLLGCHGNTAPRVLSLPPVSLPATVDAVALAA